MKELIDEWWWRHGDSVLAHIPMITFVGILLAAYVADHI